MPKIGNDWDEIIGGEFKKSYYTALRSFLKEEYATHTVYPNMYDIFSALSATPYHRVKVVILGQDPYHGEGQAHGMCFSVREGVPIPPSLINIYKEIVSELGGFIPDNGYLMPWAEQGVLLLNNVLTVRGGVANSHSKKGWEQFTDAIVEALNKRPEPMVFLLWGANAREKAARVDIEKHLCLTAAHPSPLSAYNGFFGCNHFKLANEFLIQQVKSPIQWQIPNLKETDKA
ncbi:MAG: uracil-DNA glycosylase [Clostridia bacterium]|nr:uracil-DNA glycosylase [Clostridia bacterium]